MLTLDSSGNGTARSPRSRGRRRRPNPNPRPPPPPETTTTTSSAPPSTTSARRADRSASGPAPRGRQRGTFVVPGHVFARQLTTQADATSTATTEIPSNDASNNVAATPRPKKQSASSTAPLLSTRIHEDIDNHNYECVVCSNPVTRKSKIWSCSVCFGAVHLHCLQKWAKQADNKDWRCPLCNTNRSESAAIASFCWCGKEPDPTSLPGLPPFSCAQTCSKPRQACPHPCIDVCHAGPCVPCAAMGPQTACHCGRETIARPCLNTDYTNGWSCQQICAKQKPCGTHVCQRPCHSADCGECDVLIDARCYCGQEATQLPCFKLGPELKSEACGPELQGGEAPPNVDRWLGVFDCGKQCIRHFDCGLHSCSKPCHPQSLNPAPCPTSPNLITHCPCGQTPLSTPRSACTDPIPTCHKSCHKPLACGHQCPDPCHLGNCKPCQLPIDSPCRCGKSTIHLLCHELIQQDVLLCERSCHVQLNCGRHTCSQTCCVLERGGPDRAAAKSKPRTFALHTVLNQPNILLQNQPLPPPETAHICVRMCARTLKCGNHQCEDPCHKGACPPCRNAIFFDIPCACGKTILSAARPLPCGTKQPKCRYSCTRSLPCGHHVDHTCHPDDESCPSCPVLTIRKCLCGKRDLRNIPCSASQVLCGLRCGKKLVCGLHFCSKACHVVGECEDAGVKCPHTCDREKKCCGHPCDQLCHKKTRCDESAPCLHRIIITCPCQRLQREIDCLASATSPGNKADQLACDDECRRQERNRKLQLALKIPDSHTDGHVPYSEQTLASYKVLDSVFTATYEAEMMNFATGPSKAIRFSPMRAPQRQFLHSLAADYGLDSRSLDPDPHRHVTIFKTPLFLGPPLKTIADSLRVQRGQPSTSTTAAPPPATGSAFPPLLQESNPNGFLIVDHVVDTTPDDIYARLASLPLSSSLPTLAVHFDTTIDPNNPSVAPTITLTPAFPPPPGSPSLVSHLPTLVCLLAETAGTEHQQSIVRPVCAAVVPCIVDSYGRLKHELISTAAPAAAAPASTGAPSGRWNLVVRTQKPVAWTIKTVDGNNNNTATGPGGNTSSSSSRTSPAVGTGGSSGFDDWAKGRKSFAVLGGSWARGAGKDASLKKSKDEEITSEQDKDSGDATTNLDKC